MGQSNFARDGVALEVSGNISVGDRALSVVSDFSAVNYLVVIVTRQKINQCLVFVF